MRRFKRAVNSSGHLMVSSPPVTRFRLCCTTFQRHGRKIDVLFFKASFSQELKHRRYFEDGQDIIKRKIKEVIDSNSLPHSNRFLGFLHGNVLALVALSAMIHLHFALFCCHHHSREIHIRFSVSALSRYCPASLYFALCLIFENVLPMLFIHRVLLPTRLVGALKLSEWRLARTRGLLKRSAASLTRTSKSQSASRHRVGLPILSPRKRGTRKMRPCKAPLVFLDFGVLVRALNRKSSFAFLFSCL